MWLVENRRLGVFDGVVEWLGARGVRQRKVVCIGGNRVTKGFSRSERCMDRHGADEVVEDGAYWSIRCEVRMKPQKIGSHRGNVVRGAGEVEAGYSGIDRNWNGEPGGIGQGGAEKEEDSSFSSFHSTRTGT